MDGFRGLLWCADNLEVRLLSRNLRDLSPSFPELVEAASALPRGSLVDGEIVIADESGQSDFGALQQRLSLRGSAAARAAESRPAVLLAFDLLRMDSEDLTELPLKERRDRLTRLLDHGKQSLQLVSQTSDPGLADDWLRLAPGLEGVVAKRADSRYLPGRRDWIKVKRRVTVDCVVVGVAGDLSTPKLVLALRHRDHRLHHFAVSRPLTPDLGAALAEVLPLAGAEQAPIPSRWQHDAVPAWRPIPPQLVCEVQVSNLDAKRWARFPAAFVRWRPDRSADDCGIEQLV